MTFSKFTYAFPGVIIPALLALVLYSLGFALSMFFKKKKYSTTVIVIPILCVLIILIFLLLHLSFGYRYPLSAVLQYNCDRYITTGYIDDISPAPTPPFYYNSESRTWSSGKLLTVNGNQYYIPFGDVKIGDAIELIWGNEERVVYEYSINLSHSELQIGTQLISKRIEKTPNPKLKKAGQLTATLSFAVFTILVFLQYPFGKVLNDYLIKEDMETIHTIIPQKIGLFIFALFALPFSGIIIGLVLIGFKEALLIALLISCIWIFLIIQKLNTTVTINDESITVKTFKTIHTFFKKDIENVQFHSSSRNLPYTRCLVITLRNKQRLIFDQTDFWGLESAYNTLNDGQGNDSVVP